MAQRAFMPSRKGWSWVVLSGLASAALTWALLGGPDGSRPASPGPGATAERPDGADGRKTVEAADDLIGEPDRRPFPTSDLRSLLPPPAPIPTTDPVYADCAAPLQPLEGGIAGGVPVEVTRALARLSPADREVVSDMVDSARALSGAVTRLRRENRRLRERMELAGLEPAPSLEELAERGEVRFRLKDVAARDDPIPPDVAASLGLTDELASAAEDLYRESATELRGDLEALLEELGADPTSLQSQTLNGLIDAIRDQTPPSDFEEAIRRVSGELAGRAATPSDMGSPAERMLRAIFRWKTDLRATLAELLGQETADALLADPAMSGIDHTWSVLP